MVNVKLDYRMYHHISTLGINRLRSCGTFKFSSQDNFHDLLIFDSNIIFADIRVGYYDTIDDNDVIVVRHFPKQFRDVGDLSTKGTEQYKTETRTIVISDNIAVAEYGLDRVKKVPYLCPTTPPTLSLSTPRQVSVGNQAHPIQLVISACHPLLSELLFTMHCSPERLPAPNSRCRPP